MSDGDLVGLLAVAVLLVAIVRQIQAGSRE